MYDLDMADTKFKKRIPWNKGKSGLQVAWNKDIPMKSESRQKLSESLKKAFSNPEAKRKNSEAQKKAWSNPELRKKQSESHKGQIAWNKGVSPSKEQIEKQKESFKKTLLSNPEIRKRMSELKKGKKPWITGRKHSNESLKRMSEAHKGQIAWNKGIAPSEETKKKISKSTKISMSNPELRMRLRELKKISLSNPEVRKRMSEAHKGLPSGKKGIPMSEESKRKLRESLKKLYLSNPELLVRMAKAQKESMAKPEVREKLRRNTLRMYESGSFPKQTNTKPERQIKEELIKRGYKERIDFIHQYRFMNKFMCDFCFPQQKVVIEVYGDFWHVNPNKYPKGSKLHKHQIKGIGQDKSKQAYITKVDTGSWTYLVLWESDIKKDVAKCVDRIEEVLTKKRN